MAFKDRLKEARIAKDLTQEQLGAQIGVAKSTINGYEKGNSEPDMQKLQKIMSVLCVDANYLVQDEDQALKKERPQTPDDAEVEANAIKLYEALLSSGFLKPGEDLTDLQLQVLDAISILIAASFESGTEQI